MATAGYVTEIGWCALLAVEWGGAGLLTSWLTLSGLLISWGLVPTGFLVGSMSGRGGFTSYMSSVWGVRGDCNDIQGDANELGEGRIIPGLVRLDKPLRPPGLDIDPISSSGGVPILPQLPRLSSDWFPSSFPTYRMQRFLRLWKRERESLVERSDRKLSVTIQRGNNNN